MKGRLSREIEERLSLYLDGRLPAAERAEFERRVEADPELREAIEFHRGLALEFHEEAPPLPRDFAERARARLEKARALGVEAAAGLPAGPRSPAPAGGSAAPPSWWRRPLGLSLAASAALAVIVLVIVRPGSMSRRTPEERIIARGGPPEPSLDESRGKEQAKADQETIDALRSLGYLSSGEAEPKAGRTTTIAPKTRATPARKQAPSARSPAKESRPLLDAQASRAPESAMANMQAPPAASPGVAPAPQAAQAASEAPQASTSVPFRTVALPSGPGAERDHLLIRSIDAWKAFAGEAPPPLASFADEMLIVLRDDLERDPPARLKVVAVTRSVQEIVVACRIEADEAAAGPPPAGPGQGIILAADDRPVRVVVN